ncbi:MAG: comEA [Dehalococcoidia bacterium]|nr:comEA [Dehalococcoidia bacterium]
MRTWVQVAVFLLLTAALAGGVFTLVRQPSPGRVEITLPTPTPTPEMKVYITGAVGQPGVYQVSPEDRLEDVLRMAGGLTEDADPARVNQALRVADEAHFHIPAIGEVIPTPTATSVPGKVNINTASVGELQALPGIGEVKAGAIVEYRQKNGSFSRVEDLLLVPGIGPTTLENIRDSITVN